MWSMVKVLPTRVLLMLHGTKQDCDDSKWRILHFKVYAVLRQIRMLASSMTIMKMYQSGTSSNRKA